MEIPVKDGQTVVGSVETGAGSYVVTTRETGRVTVAKDAIQAIRNKDEQAAHEKEADRLRNPGLLDLWAGHADFGLATSRGNARITTLNSGARATRATTRDKIGVQFTSIYATNATKGPPVTTANAMRGGVRYDVTLNARSFAFGFTDLEFDEFQRLDLRHVLGGGFGVKAYRRDKSFLDFFGGASSNREFFATGLRRNSAEVVIGQELAQQLGAATVFTQKFVLYPNVSTRGAYRINFDTSLSTALRKWLAWQIAVSDRYLSNPIAGARPNDILFTTGLRLTFAK
ncbi:MAG: DUF481 domain-containing protein [Acidobacteria bacterium]|nr:DUF481 domain-containing protein [Acidobacteriota bacterium]